MKKFILLTTLLLASLTIVGQTKPCPIEGTATHENSKTLNKFKNRSIDTTLNFKPISLDSFLLDGKDYERFNQDRAIMVTGYVAHISKGGVESCNCGSTIESQQDIHIYIGKTPTSEKRDCMVIEITPKFKALNKGFDYKALNGQKVNVYGLFFFDWEHKGNAANTCIKCSRVWRKTAWEIHPVMKLELSN